MKNTVNQYIVITSIFNPTEAVISFSKMKSHKLLVVGDKKTPANWHYNNVEYLSVSKQQKNRYALTKVLPYNHYCRKMMGYLMAMQNGADYIIDTDDDNIPKSNWKFPEFEGEFNCVQHKGFLNIYEYYTTQKIWPRGLPLNLINEKFEIEKKSVVKKCKVGIWQGLADEDPDVDAIYRLADNKPCYFKNRKPIVLDKNAITPFNSQNTIFKRELFPLLYLPTYVTFRFTDILRGLVAQPIMWLYGYRLGFTNATVVQKRNPHDYMKDFISEIPMYLHSEKIIDIVSSVIKSKAGISGNLYLAYQALLKENIVTKEEIETLQAWLKDIEAYGF